MLKRKVSGPTRSRRGDEFIAPGFAKHESCRRQGVDLSAHVHRAVIAWIDKAPPSQSAAYANRLPPAGARRCPAAIHLYTSGLGRG